MKKALIAPLLFIVFVGYASATRLTPINGVRTKSYKNHTRVIVETGSAIEFTQNRIINPHRLYFDLKNCMLQKKSAPSLPVENGILKQVRIAQFDRSTVRIVLDVQKLESFYAFALDNPHRLVIDVYDQKQTAPPVKSEEDISGPDIPAVKTIVIDPGHGGDDPGAVGPTGLMEKDIVLDVGKKLGDILASKQGIEVIYTRDKDVFIPLNERTEIANSQKADLFISVHANASPRRNAKGIETYFLNWTNDAEAMRVAARENKISFRKMEKMQGDLQMILQDLARKNKNEESMRLASSVQNSMVNTLKEDYGKVEDHGVKYAFFYVLVGAEMPSILVEISFISNREEEKRLSKDHYKDKLAEAIAQGINSYLTQTTLVVKKSQ
ncbi:MAG: N-acetylmuramoyl-L-alanine amidase [Nitrospirae bacterium]|nr:N-acetylmuramoyl-L-alanine amidase [Nitrospirota bacterium]